MNPFLASAIILILRWLQLIAARGIISEPEYHSKLDGMLDETKAFSQRLTIHALQTNDMSDYGKQVM